MNTADNEKKDLAPDTEETGTEVKKPETTESESTEETTEEEGEEKGE